MEKVIEDLKKESINVNSKQVQEKLNKLRNYYGAERRKEESSKVSGSGTNSVYTSSWRFYESLHFLRDNLIPRSTTSNIDENEDREDGAYTTNNPPSAKSARKLREKSRENAECVMAKASKALECITARYQNAPEEKKIKKNEDKLFADMVYEMLSTIPDCMPKAMVKLEFQQKLIQLKYNTAIVAPPNYVPTTPLSTLQSFTNTFPQQASEASNPHSRGSSLQGYQGNSRTHSIVSPTSTSVPSPVYPSF